MSTWTARNVMGRVERWHFRQRGIATVAALVMFLLAEAAPAQVAIPATRVVFTARQQSVSVPVVNKGGHSVLIQAWVAGSSPDQPPEESTAPFVLAPPLLKLEPGRSKPVRIQKIAQQAPKDAVEHLYWLNVLAIPARQGQGEHGQQAEQGQLELAVRSVYKLFYRPDGVGKPNDPPGSLRIRVSHGEQRQLELANASAFHLNLGHVFVRQADGSEHELDNPMVPPHGAATIALPDSLNGTLTSVRFAWIDDNGNLHEVVRAL